MLCESLITVFLCSNTFEPRKQFELFKQWLGKLITDKKGDSFQQSYTVKFGTVTSHGWLGRWPQPVTWVDHRLISVYRKLPGVCTNADCKGLPLFFFTRWKYKYKDYRTIWLQPTNHVQPTAERGPGEFGHVHLRSIWCVLNGHKLFNISLIIKKFHHCRHNSKKMIQKLSETYSILIKVQVPLLTMFPFEGRNR